MKQVSGDCSYIPQKIFKDVLIHNGKKYKHVSVEHTIYLKEKY
jgi:ribosomal protein S19